MSKINEWRFYMLLIVFSLIVIGGGIIFAHLADSNEKIGKNVEISGVSLQGLNVEDAETVVRENTVMPKKITLIYEGKTFSLLIDHEKAEFDYSKAVQEAIDSKCIFNEISWFSKKIALDVPIIVNDFYLKTQIRDLKSSFDRQQNVSLNETKTFEIVKDYLDEGLFNEIPINTD